MAFGGEMPKFFGGRIVPPGKKCLFGLEAPQQNGDDQAALGIGLAVHIGLAIHGATGMVWLLGDFG